MTFLEFLLQMFKLFRTKRRPTSTKLWFVIIGADIRLTIKVKHFGAARQVVFGRSCGQGGPGGPGRRTQSLCVTRIRSCQ